MKNNARIYAISALFITLILTVIRSLSLKYHYDPQIGYFNETPFVTLMHVAIVAGVILLASSIFVIQKNTVSCPTVLSSLPLKSSAMFCAMIFSVSAVSLFFYTESKFAVFAGMFAFVSAIYFILIATSGNKTNITSAFLSILPIISFLLSTVTVYFDMKIAMNSPHKIMSGICLLSAVLFSLCETRVLIDRALPRLHFFLGLITFLLGFTYCTSTLIYLLTANLSEFQKRPVILGNIGFIGIILSFSIYAIFRCFTFKTNEIQDISAQ